MLTEIDKEIIVILKETFRSKSKNELIDPDDLMRESFIKWTFSISLILIIMSFFDNENLLRTFTSAFVSVFFMLLFFQINIKSKNPSIIMYVMTYISVMIPIWL